MRAPLDDMRIRNPFQDHSDYSGMKNLVSRPLAGTRSAHSRKNSDGTDRPHNGWDLYAKPKTKTFAICDGKVAASGYGSGFGHYITLAFDGRDPEDGCIKTLYALYGHLSRRNFGAGKEVKEGDVLGLTGTSGIAEGGPPHLHFAILRHHVPKKGDYSNTIDPGYFLGFGALNFEQLFPGWNRA